MDNNNDDFDISTEEEAFDNSESFNESEHTEEEVDWKTKALELEEKYNNQKIRAEKAEKKAKEGSVPQTQSQAKKDDLSSSDLYALMTSKVPQEDISDVKEYADLKGISIAEALKSNVVKTILKENEESRNVTEATNTGGSRRVSTRVSDEALLSKAMKGDFPENDEEIRRLIRAQKQK